MGLSLITAPLLEPVTPGEAAEQCRVEPGCEVGYLERLIRAARQLVEADTRRALLRQTWRLTLDTFAEWEIRIPRPRFLGVEATITAPTLGIVYEDPGGTDVVLTNTHYRITADEEPAILTPPLYGYWPYTSDRTGALRITFEAGYGDSPADVPEGIKQAILYAVAHWYRNREPLSEGTMAPVPMTFDRLLDEYRCPEIR